MIFTFLILHYKNEESTVESIDSVLSSSKDHDIRIVVVDNASNNGSLEKLQDRYHENSTIFFIHNDENMGYAKGNNIGFLFAKNVLNTDWICLINNDITINNDSWINKIVLQYNKYPFYILGPDVMTPEGSHQNPFRLNIRTLKRVKKDILHDRIVLILLKIKLQHFLRKFFVTKVNEQSHHMNSETNFNGVLHGSCLVFSPKFIKEFNGLYSGTFLYAEEDILCYILQTLRYPYTYFSDVQVIHKHSLSMKKEIGNEDLRKMRILKHRIYSNKQLVKIMKTKDGIKQYLM